MNVKLSEVDFSDSPATLDAVRVRACGPGVNAGNKVEQLVTSGVPIAEQVTPVRATPVDEPSS